ncbi:MAG: hypothetical protein CMJ59_12335 [Planctomycetaceae bacterium]|nr:hypothetical protein [Planctomycetaceae bacterium]
MRAILVFLCWLVALPGQSGAQDRFDFFERRIRPVLVRRCYACHSAAAAEIKGGLRLDSRPAMRRGGDSGPAVVAGQPERSLLIAAIKRESLEMPPDESLPAGVIRDFENWIRQGASDPRDTPPTASEAAALNWEVTLAARRDWWSLKPVRNPSPPQDSGGWSDHDIDAFVARRLGEAGLRPGRRGEPRTRARRLALTLTGLPPEPDALAAFLDQSGQDPDRAWRVLVDAILRSPHFGERWARHWMDVVRFTETHGNEWNYEVHYAWRYRDYLVRAFNADVPYDQFVREHIAGDLLERPRTHPQQGFNESVIGTAFYRFGEVNHDDCIAITTIGYDILANQIDTLTKAFLGSTVACARCHDHKIDAFSTRDYHSLLGILRSSRFVAHAIDAPGRNDLALDKLAALKSAIRGRLVELWRAEIRLASDHLLAAQLRHQQEQADKSAASQQPTASPAAVGDQVVPLVERWKKWLPPADLPLQHPAHVWQQIAARGADTSVAKMWKSLAEQYRAERSRRQRHNDDHYQLLYDLRGGSAGWVQTGDGIARSQTAAGELAVLPKGPRIAQSILPEGLHTHRLTQHLGGALRSPILHPTRKYISLRVLGGERAAVRIVSNNCQLNYVNYKVLLSDRLGWITFTPPTEQEQLRPYIELLTKFFNPKFPDQLATIGGAAKNDRVPWDEVASDPRSFFGISHVVAHDNDAPPEEDLDYLCQLFEDAAVPTTLVEVAARYQQVLVAAVEGWSQGRVTESSRQWVDALVRHNLVSNYVNEDTQLERLVAEFRRVEQSEIQRPRIVPGVEDVDEGIDQPILVRGVSTEFGAPTPRRFVHVLDPMGGVYQHGSGRLELANDITSPSNTLTARVMVNRVWHHLFGSGLVRTVDDLGRLGELSSHPDLLDHLARRFMAGGWSVKQLIRSIVTSETFQMTSRVTTEAYQVDPLNRLLHHYPARRLEAEAIRDNILAAAGTMDRALGGASIYPFREKPNAFRRLFVGPLDGNRRRSIYIKTNLMEPTRFLSAFNTPGGKLAQGRRESSNVPAQALALLNDPFVLQQAGKWSGQLVEGETSTRQQRIDSMFLAALSRAATSQELQQFDQLISRFAELYAIPDDAVMSSVSIWQDMAHVIFNLKEFIYIP